MLVSVVMEKVKVEVEMVVVVGEEMMMMDGVEVK